MKEAGDKLAPADKSAIEAALVDAKAVLDSGDAAQIRAKIDALAQVSMKLGEAMYKQDGATPGAAPEAPKEEGVVDAEFSEVKEDKKGAA